MYSSENVKVGDLVSIYIKRNKSGAEMGPEIRGKAEYLTDVIYNGTVYNNDNFNALYPDTLTGVGMALEFKDIVQVKPKEGLGRLEYHLRHKAATISVTYLPLYVRIFHKMPFYKGTFIKVKNNYQEWNRGAKIRNNNKILKSDKLVFENWNKDDNFITVKCLHYNQTAKLAISAIEGFSFNHTNRHYLLYSIETHLNLVKAETPLEAVYLLAKSQFDEAMYKDVVENQDIKSTDEKDIADHFMGFEISFILDNYEIQEVEAETIDKANLVSNVTLETIPEYANKHVLKTGKEYLNTLPEVYKNYLIELENYLIKGDYFDKPGRIEKTYSVK